MTRDGVGDGVGAAVAGASVLDGTGVAGASVLDGTGVAGASVLDGTGVGGTSVADGTGVGGTSVGDGMTACEPKAGTAASGMGEPVGVRAGASAFAAAFGAGVAHNWGVTLAPAVDAVVPAPEPPVAGILRAPIDGAWPSGPGNARRGSGAAAAALAGADCASTDLYWSGRGVAVGDTVERVSLAWELWPLSSRTSASASTRGMGGNVWSAVATSLIRCSGAPIRSSAAAASPTVASTQYRVAI